MQNSQFADLVFIEKHQHSVDSVDYDIEIYRVRVSDEHLGDYKAFISTGGQAVGDTYDTSYQNIFDAGKENLYDQAEFIEMLLQLVRDDIDKNLNCEFR